MTGIDGQVASDTVNFTVPPRLSVVCTISDNILMCDGTNTITSQFCIFDTQSPIQCTSPFSFADLGLTVGPHSVTVFVVDIFEQQAREVVDFTVISNLRIVCQESNSLTAGEVDCQSTDGIGAVTFTCSYDGEPPEDCKLNHMIYMNTTYFVLFEYHRYRRVSNSFGPVPIHTI